MEQENKEAGTAPKKSRLGLVLAIVVVIALVAGAAVAGTLLGPKLVGHGSEKPGKPAKHGKHAEPEPEAEADTEAAIGETTEFPPIVVDTRAKDATIHHLKVVIAVEVAEGTKKEEFMKYSPRGREAAVAFLRSQPFESVSDPEKYGEIREALAKTYSEAVGTTRVARVLITDFVAQ